MKRYQDLRLFYATNGIRYKVNIKEPFALFYLSENSNLLDDYPKLHIMQQDIRYAVIPTTRIPRTRMVGNDKLLYKDIKLYVLSDRQKLPKGKNIIVDLSKYINAIDEKYKPTQYRQRAGRLIVSFFYNSLGLVPNNYKKVLVYSVDKNKPVNKFINKKFFPFLQLMKDDQLKNDILYTQINESGSEQRFVQKDGITKLDRFIQYLKKKSKYVIKTDENEESEIEEFTPQEEAEETAKKSSKEILKKITKDKNYSKEKEEKIENAVRNYLKDNPDVHEELENEPLDIKKASEIATTAILANVSGDADKAVRISKNVNHDKKEKVLDVVVEKYVDEILPKEKPVSTSTEVSLQEMNIPEVVDNKSPEHIFKYRQKNIETNLEKDIKSTFEVLKDKDGKLQIESINIIEKESNPGELLKSDINTVETILVDEKGKKHKVKIDIPKINNYGVFTINGKTKCLINQIVQLPITFPKKYDSKFESSYGAFHIVSKKERSKDYLQIFIGSYKLPLFVVLASRFGFKKVCEDYKLKYTIEEKNKTDFQYNIRIGNKQYVYFHDVNTQLKKELVNSLLKVKISAMKIEGSLESPDFFNDIILNLTGRVNSVYRIQSSFDNIVDPIVKQILLNRQLPSTLDKIMYYMASKVIEGYVIKRNDISNQRIRNSEIIAQLVQQQVHTAYTIYREQLLSGNVNAKLDIPQTKVLTDFVNSEIVTNMEYANPIEEMSVMTRVSPVGSNIGGIPDKRAVTGQGRNVSDSLFGSIDPLDTPEGGSVGITQHLAIDADITSTRGMFKVKPINDKEKSGVLSTSTALIPFSADDDGTRVMFGANQARQSLPLKNPEAPLVQSGYESILSKSLSDNFIKKAPCDGEIISITRKEMKMKCSDGKIKIINTEPKHLISGSGKNTLSTFRPLVTVNKKVKKDTLIAEGSCVKNGAIAIGKTLCTAVMPYKGYNFEDGIVISESLAKSEKLTSLHGIVEEINVDELDKILLIIEPGLYVKKGEPIFRKIVGDINELLGDIDTDEFSEISGGQYIKKSPGAKIIDVEVFSNIPLEKGLKPLEPYAIKTRKKYKLGPDDAFMIKKEKIKDIKIKITMEQELSIQVGDKLTNRHGAKGIVSLIEKDEYMPVTPWGERVEIIVNPIGIINRMNVGQLYELYTGLISHVLGQQIVQLKDKTKVINLLQQVLPILDKTKEKLLSTRFIRKIAALPQSKFNIFISEIQNNKGFTLIIPPFKQPSKEDLLKALKLLNLKDSYKLKLSEFGNSTMNEVPVGYVYFEKLEHISSEKVFARSTGPVTSKSMQPTAGRKNMGGQRVGEMDVYSLLSYNAKTVLTELLGPMSDDINAKNECISNIIKDGNTPFVYTGKTASKDLLNNYMVSLMLTRS